MREEAKMLKSRWLLNLAPYCLVLSLVGCNHFSESEETQSIRSAAGWMGGSLDLAEAKLVTSDLKKQRESYQRLQTEAYSESLSPAFVFSPFQKKVKRPFSPKPTQLVLARPKKLDQLPEPATLSIAQLQQALNSGQTTSYELTRYFLERIEAKDPKLRAFISLRGTSALEQAQRLDQERSKGRLRSPLHGIPFAAKDLFATKNLKTTWGAEPYKDQQFDYDAAALVRLEEAGAILIGKTAMGALAWGDEWYGGQTKNPHNLKEGSGGSSAGSAAAVSAGLVPFALGTETWGSLISPAESTGVSALRPSMGRVSRFGVMPLSWTMDKVGVICRHIEDCGLVFSVIAGYDPRDPASLSAPFKFNERNPQAPGKVHHLQVSGEIYSEDFKQWYEKLVGDLNSTPMHIGPAKDQKFEVMDLSLILKAEASASFAELTLSNRDELLKKQRANAYPNYFRAGRMIPAVEYIQMNRIRDRLMDSTESQLKKADILIAPAQGDHLLLTNLTGHPAVYVALKKLDDGKIAGVTLMSEGLSEAKLLEFGMLLQKKSSVIRSLPLN